MTSTDMIVLKLTLALTLVAICTSLPFSPRDHVDVETVIRNQNNLRVQSVLQDRTYLKTLDKRNGECHQVGYTASCCQHIKFDEIGLNSTVCVVMTYLPTDYGLSLSVTIDGKVIIQETVSARNPPPLCADVPYLKKYASICLRFYNLDWSSSIFSGCTKIQIELIKIKLADFDLGCFKIPIVESESNLTAVRSNFIADGTDLAFRRTDTLKEDIFDHLGVKKSKTSWSKEISVIST